MKIRFDKNDLLLAAKHGAEIGEPTIDGAFFLKHMCGQIITGDLVIVANYPVAGGTENEGENPDGNGDDSRSVPAQT